MIFVAGRHAIDIDSGRIPLAWDSDGEPMFRDDPPCFFSVEGFASDEYDDQDDDIGMRDTLPPEVMF